jgi:SAM-dependent methyltransferase
MPLNPGAIRRISAAINPERAPAIGAAAARSGDAGRENSTAELFHFQERERHVLRLLRRYGLLPLAGKKILDVGCGTGRWLRDLIAWGAEPENLFGVELLQASAARARRLCPTGVTIDCANAAELRFPSQSFDIVLQARVFTSILDENTKRAIADEMLRVVRPTGIILWYDSLVTHPGNPYVRPASKSEIRRLFPGCSLDLHRISLASPLIRLLAPRAWGICSMLSRFPLFCTHYLGAISQSQVKR